MKGGREGREGREGSERWRVGKVIEERDGEMGGK